MSKQHRRSRDNNAYLYAKSDIFLFYSIDAKLYTALKVKYLGVFGGYNALLMKSRAVLAILLDNMVYIIIGSVLNFK